MKRVYLDYAATTPLHPEVKQEMMEALEGTYGNPSSIHSFGRESRKLLVKLEAKLHGVSEPFFFDYIYEWSNRGKQSSDLWSCTAHAHKGKHIITTQLNITLFYIQWRS